MGYNDICMIHSTSSLPLASAKTTEIRFGVHIVKPIQSKLSSLVVKISEENKEQIKAVDF